MISFYPGPSRVYAKIPAWVADAYQEGIMSINHRSPEFIKISTETIQLLKKKLAIPEDYRIFFTSSATECWEIISQSLVRKESCHLYNGAFGEKWCQYARKLQKEATGKAFALDEAIHPETLRIGKNTDVICVTQNETSNGTSVSNAVIGQIKSRFPETLVAVDATSSMAGVYLDFASADVWFASVQKCFGLPAGLAVMVCSPQVIQTARTIGENNHYNSLLFIIEQMRNMQTTYTPNVLNIYLMMRSLREVAPINAIDKKLTNRFFEYIRAIEKNRHWRLLVAERAVLSKTVLCLQADEQQVQQVKAEAKKAGIVVGNGYGKWKNNTFRIANFPAIEEEEFFKLKSFLENQLS